MTWTIWWDTARWECVWCPFQVGQTPVRMGRKNKGQSRMTSFCIILNMTEPLLPLHPSYIQSRFSVVSKATTTYPKHANADRQCFNIERDPHPQSSHYAGVADKYSGTLPSTFHSPPSAGTSHSSINGPLPSSNSTYTLCPLNRLPVAGIAADSAKYVRPGFSSFSIRLCCATKPLSQSHVKSPSPWRSGLE